jgi:hypothetical protein
MSGITITINLSMTFREKFQRPFEASVAFLSIHQLTSLVTPSASAGFSK